MDFSLRKVMENVSTHDLPLFLQSAVDAIVTKYYERKTSPWRTYTVQDTVPDFRDVRYKMIFTEDQLDKLLEGEPYREGKLQEEERTWKIAKYGKLLKISYEAMVNDDTRAVRDLAQNYGRMTEALEPILVTDVLDGVAVSDDYAGNALSGALDEAFLERALTSFTMQQTAQGRRLAATPRYLVASSKWKNTLRTLLRPTTALDFNPIDNAIEVVEEPYLKNLDKAYLIGDPLVLPALEVDFLSVPGDPRENYASGPRTFWEGGVPTVALPSQVGQAGEGFRYDTINYKVRHVLGAGIRDPFAIMCLEFTS